MADARDEGSGTAAELAGPPGLRAVHLQRAPIRTRGGEMTRSVWRVQAESDQGPGSIMRVDLAADRTVYRGDGVFLGVSQGELAALFGRLAASLAEDHPFEIPQKG